MNRNVSFFIVVLGFFANYLQGNEKLKILYIVRDYPQISQTYIHEEIACLKDNYEIKIIATQAANVARKNFFPYELIPASQDDFYKCIDQIITEFQPHILHTHWFFNAPLLKKLSETYYIPFTIRSHSFDVLSVSPATLTSFCSAANSPLCLGVLCFPAFVDKLVQHGLEKKKITSCMPVMNFEAFYNPQKKSITKRICNIGAGLPKKDYESFLDFAKQFQNKEYEFNLYIMGYFIEKYKQLNKELGNPASFIGYVEPEEMPKVYQKHDWLVFTACPKYNSVGFPITIAEAQASGIGICWQELPGRKQEQLEFLGGAGYLFNSVPELNPILEKPYPEEMRQRGYENAKRCDIKNHITLLTDIWDQIIP